MAGGLEAGLDEGSVSNSLITQLRDALDPATAMEDDAASIPAAGVAEYPCIPCMASPAWLHTLHPPQHCSRP